MWHETWRILWIVAGVIGLVVMGLLLVLAVLVVEQLLYDFRQRRRPAEQPSQPAPTTVPARRRGDAAAPCVLTPDEEAAWPALRAQMPGDLQ